MGILSSGKKARKGPWILGGILGAVLLFGILFAVLVPILVVRWLGGEDFRRLASEQISQVLKTKGDLSPLQWSSFSVFAGSFVSQPGALEPWVWDIQEIRTEVSPRLLFDRILRFSEISVGSVSLSPGTVRTGPTPPILESVKTNSTQASADLFQDVQIGKLEVRSFSLTPAPTTKGWGAQGVQIVVFPGKQKTDFNLQKGRILSPIPWWGELSLHQAKGRYVPPTLYLTELMLKSIGGGQLSASGDFTSDSSLPAHGQMAWEKWEVPGGRLGLGLFEVPARVSGKFTVEEWTPSGVVGKGTISLVDARLEPGRGSETVLALLSVLTGEARLRGCSLSTAEASFRVTPGRYDIHKILVEAPGLLRVLGQIQILNGGLQGEIDLGLSQNLGAKVSSLTGVELFKREENGYLYQSVQIRGTLENPQNDLQPKLAAAVTRTLIRTGAQILEKAAGANGGGSGNDAAGQALRGIRSLFAPPNP
jgi:hypothetical protein